MVKVVVKSLMVVAVVTGLVFYALYLKTGRLPWGDSQWSVPSLPSLSTPRLSLEGVKPSSRVQVYKWVDADGVTHYSQELPSGEHQVLELDPRSLNTIPAVTVPPPGDRTAPAEEPAGDYRMSDGNTSLEKAREAAELLKAREREQRKILNDL